MAVDEANELFDFWNEHPEFLGLVRADGSTSSASKPSRLATKSDVRELLALQG